MNRKGRRQRRKGRKMMQKNGKRKKRKQQQKYLTKVTVSFSASIAMFPLLLHLQTSRM
jgi:hypothetical protein